MKRTKDRVSLAGFSVIELLVTMVIVGILAAIVIPTFQLLALKSQAGEGRQVLHTLRDAQEWYRFETGAYAGDPADLDIIVPEMKYFQNLQMFPAAEAYSCSVTEGNFIGTPLVQIDAINGSYSLMLVVEGDVYCGPCDNDVCRRLDIPFGEEQ